MYFLDKNLSVSQWYVYRIMIIISEIIIIFLNYLFIYL